MEHCQSNGNYDLGNEIVYNTEVLKSNLCDNNNAYILLIDIITIVGNVAARVALKICAPFTKPITKLMEPLCATEDLDLVMPIHNSLKHSSDYSDTTNSLWFCSKDKAANFNNAMAADDDKFKSFKYKTTLIGSTADENGRARCNKCCVIKISK